MGDRSSLIGYDEFGKLVSMNYSGYKTMNYGFDDFGNLHYREDAQSHLKEEFEYDDMNRIETVKYFINGIHQTSDDLIMTYDDNGYGNITSKSDVADVINYGEIYEESDPGPNALTSMQELNDYLPNYQNITYTSFNKVKSITQELENENTINLDIIYGIDDQRRQTVFTNSADPYSKVTRYFFGDYEKVTYYYANYYDEYIKIYAPTGLCAIYKYDYNAGSGYDSLWHVNTDHLGSIALVCDSEDDTKTREFSYNAWGQPRDPDDWTTLTDDNLLANRGFTEHEHLPEFDLINMNGRVYDPVLARFLSPDPFVQVPAFNDGFNRYAYCLNNPLIYTDPDGEFIFTALLTPIGLTPLGVILDGACWSAAIDAGFQGFRMLTGKQDKFNFAELGGAAIAGAVTAGMGFMAPSFTVTSTSFLSNLPTYAGKAGWTALTGSLSTGAGMFTSDLLDNGKIDISGKDYLRAMGTAGLISGGVSFGNSLYEYGTWDKFDTKGKLAIMEKKFGANDRKLLFDPDLNEYGKSIPSSTARPDKIYFGPKAFSNKRLAIATGRHEVAHLTNSWQGTRWANRMIGRGFTGERYDYLTEFNAKRVGMRTWGVDMNYWIEKAQMVNSNPWNVNLFWPSFGLDQLLSPFF